MMIPGRRRAGCMPHVHVRCDDAALRAVLLALLAGKFQNRRPEMKARWKRQPAAERKNEARWRQARHHLRQ
jgi:hypothetical protein